MKYRLRLVYVLLAILTLVVSLPAALAQEGTGEKPLWGWATVADYEAATGQKLPPYAESPALADLVSQGKLPPVAERLPVEPLVDNPFEEVGKFGGKMTLGQVSAGILPVVEDVDFFFESRLGQCRFKSPLIIFRRLIGHELGDANLNGLFIPLLLCK